MINRLIMGEIISLLSYAIINSKWTKKFDFFKKNLKLKKLSVKSWWLKQKNKLLIIKLVTENFVQQKAKSKTMASYSWWIPPTLIWQTNLT